MTDRPKKDSTEKFEKPTSAPDELVRDLDPKYSDKQGDKVQGGRMPLQEKF